MSVAGRQNQPSCQKKQWIGPRRECYGLNPWQSRATTVSSYDKLSYDSPPMTKSTPCSLMSPANSKAAKTMESSSVKYPCQPHGWTEECRRRATALEEAHGVWLCWFPDGSQPCVGTEKNWGGEGLKRWGKPIWAAEVGQQAATPWYDAWLGKPVQVPHDAALWHKWTVPHEVVVLLLQLQPHHLLSPF